jgi:hypothetical protein
MTYVAVVCMDVKFDPWGGGEEHKLAAPLHKEVENIVT